MARPERIKTPLGQRLSDVRKALGYDERVAFADLLGLPKDTLGNYERGDREPDLRLLAVYRDRFGVDLNWLATGEGEMFAVPAKVPAVQIDAELMERLHDRVWTIFLDVGQTTPPRRVIREVANVYNDLKKAVSDVADAEMVEAALPMILLEFKRRIERARDEPGTGKRLA